MDRFGEKERAQDQNPARRTLHFLLLGQCLRRDFHGFGIRLFAIHWSFFRLYHQRELTGSAPGQLRIWSEIRP